MQIFKDMFDNVYVIDELFTSKGLNFLIDEYKKEIIEK